MKIFNKIWGVGLLAVLLALVTPKKSMAQEGGYISDQQFYDELQPYGTWVSDPEYGNVWVPDAEEDFRPYGSRGHWVVTEYGDTWVSDYKWGWAPFHYGRWRYDDYYGWVWIPGHDWAPAWVSWRHGGGYYGWAPLTPGLSVNISIGIGSGRGSIPDNYWVCAPEAYITRRHIYNYYVPHTRSVTIIRNTTIINNTYVNNNVTYVRGPRVEEIRKVTRRNVTVYKVNNSGRPGNVNITNKTVNIYRPAVKASTNARPSRVVDGAAYRQQNPNAGIANKKDNRAGYNHANAAKLATIARDKKPDNKVVRVNPVDKQPEDRPGQSNRPANAGVKPAQADRPANKPGQPDRPAKDITKPTQQRDARPANKPNQPNNPAQDKPANRPSQPAAKPANTLQEGQQQIKEEAAQKRQDAQQQTEQRKQQLQLQNEQKNRQLEESKQQVKQQTDQRQQQAEQQRQQAQQKQQELLQQKQEGQQQAEQIRQQAQQKQQELQQQKQQAEQQRQQKQQQLQQQNQQRQQQAEQQRQRAQQKQQQLQQQNQQRQQQRPQKPRPENKPEPRPAQR